MRYVEETPRPNKFDRIWEKIADLRTRVEKLEAQAAHAEAKPTLAHAIEVAWGVIANAGGGDWTKESKDWQEAAAKWRDECYAPYASGQSKSVGAKPEGADVRTPVRYERYCNGDAPAYVGSDRKKIEPEVIMRILNARRPNAAVELALAILDENDKRTVNEIICNRFGLDVTLRTAEIVTILRALAGKGK